MKDVRKANYDVFQNCESSNHRNELIGTMHYIDHLAQMAHVNIANWPVLQIFKNKRSEKEFIHTDRNKINEIFFAELERIRLGGGVETFKLTTNEHDVFAETFRQLHGIRRNQLEERYKTNLNKSTSDYSNYTRAIAEAAKAKREIDGFETGNYQDQIQQVDEIIAAGFWKCDKLDVGTSYLQFETDLIVLTQKNDAAKINIELPMGKFVCRLRMQDDPISLLVLAWDKIFSIEKSGNIILGSGHYHPHVNADGRVCFGTMLTDFTKAAIDRDLVKIMEFVRLAICRYYNNNPFVYLHSFRDELEARRTREQEKKKARDEGRSPERVAGPIPPESVIEPFIRVTERPGPVPGSHWVDAERIAGHSPIRVERGLFDDSGPTQEPAPSIPGRLSNTNVIEPITEEQESDRR